jgi:DNA polymerase epsilon subunit 1
MQNMPNPVPRVAHPDWLHKRVATRLDRRKQHLLTNMFGAKPTAKRGQSEEGGAVAKGGGDSDVDMEDMDALAGGGAANAAARRQCKKRRKLATLYRVRI